MFNSVEARWISGKHIVSLSLQNSNIRFILNRAIIDIESVLSLIVLRHITHLIAHHMYKHSPIIIIVITFDTSIQHIHICQPFDI